MNNNILLLSAGSNRSLFNLINEELKLLFPDSMVIAADANPQYSAVCQLAEKSVKLPYTTDNNFPEVLKYVCLEFNISLIIPCTDFDTNALVLAMEENKIPEDTDVLVSSKDFVLKCQDKVLSCAIFKDANVDFLMPLAKEDFEFPLFMKPRYGYQSEDCRLIYEEEDLPQSILNQEDFGDYIFQYYLSPDDFDEYSISTYYNKKSGLLSAVPCKIIGVRGGKVSKSKTAKNEIYNWVWENFSFLEGARGPINIQCFLNKKTKEIVAGEINARFGSVYALTHASGSNHIKYSLEEYLSNRTILPVEKWKENILMLRFDEELIIAKEK